VCPSLYYTSDIIYRQAARAWLREHRAPLV
jgi:hypothetical protein